MKTIKMVRNSLFVLILVFIAGCSGTLFGFHNLDKKYEEECSMAMDCFLEEEFDLGECTRFLEYLLTLVKEEKADEIQVLMENYLEKNG